MLKNKYEILCKNLEKSYLNQEELKKRHNLEL